METDLDAALTALNHKLIEIHSRLKAIDEEAFEVLGNNGGGAGGQTAASRSNASTPSSQHAAAAASTSSTSTATLSTETVVELVEQCQRVLRQPRRGRRRKKRRSGEGEDAAKLSSSSSFVSNHHALAAQLLAELGKSELGRGICLERQVAVDLEVVLAAQLEDEGQGGGGGGGGGGGEMETTVQILRVLGNLCYNCNEGREQVIRSKCLERVIGVASDRARVASSDPCQRFPVILPGFLLNFCNDNRAAVRVAGSLGFVAVVARNVLDTQTNDAVFNASLNFLVAVAEADDQAGLEPLRSCADFPTALNHVLVHTTSPEVTETALELVRSVAEDPQITLTLATKSPLCTTLVNHIVGRWRSREFEEHRSDACDLLVLILSHDACMRHLYATEDGKFLQTFLGR